MSAGHHASGKARIGANGQVLSQRCGRLYFPLPFLSWLSSGVVANFLYTQRKTGQREIEKWRREELLKLTSSLLRLSARRQENLMAVQRGVINGYTRVNQPAEPDTVELALQMGLDVEQIRLLDGGMALAEAAAAVWQAHADTERDYYPQPSTYDDVDQLIIAPKVLNALHAAVVDCFHENVGVRRRRWGPLSPNARKVESNRENVAAAIPIASVTSQQSGGDSAGGPRGRGKG